MRIRYCKLFLFKTILHVPGLSFGAIVAGKYCPFILTPSSESLAVPPVAAAPVGGPEVNSDPVAALLEFDIKFPAAGVVGVVAVGVVDPPPAVVAATVALAFPLAFSVTFCSPGDIISPVGPAEDVVDMIQTNGFCRHKQRKQHRRSDALLRFFF